jgi:ABC-type transport system substrate-binding protein
MRTKWLLITLPLIVFGVLAQSAFWVPTYESQANGNPARLTTFLRAQIGDPKLLNPILISDQAAQIVMNNKVSEALVDADENSKLVPCLAERWETTEEAYVAVLPDRKLPDGTLVTPGSLLAALRAAWKHEKIPGLEHSIQSIELVPGEVRALSETVLVDSVKGKREPLEVAMSVQVPERVRLRLSNVDPHLFAKLESVLGVSYFQNYPFASRFQLKNPEYLAKVKDRLPELLGIGEHNPIITFYLRPGVRWHDGAPFTAEDVKFTYEALIDPKNAAPRSSSFDPIKSVEVVNELTARVTYKHLYAPAFIDWTLEIIPKHLLDGPALTREMDGRHIFGEARKTFSIRNSDYSRNPIGTGPWRFVEWLPDQYIHLTRNENYWRPKAEYRDLYFRTIPDFLTMELEFQAGALDRYDALPHQAERYAKNQDYQVVRNAEGRYEYIGYNMRRPLFQDPRVRRALGMAIDVNSIIRYVLYGQAKRSNGPFYSNTPYNDTTVEPLPYDPRAALALLSAAGWSRNAAGMLEKDGKPLQFTLVTNNGNPQRKAIMTLAQEAWRQIGVECKIQAFEWAVFLGDFVNNNNFDAIVFGWSGADMNPDKYQVWHSSRTGPYELNHVGYQSAEADALLERIRTEYDPDEQIQLTHQLHRRIAEDQPFTFLFEPFKPVVLDRRIARILRAPDGQEKAERIVTAPSGSMDQFFPQWRKLSTMPEDSPE